MSFDNGDIDLLSGISEIVELEQGELLFLDQDSGVSVYLVISGSIDMFTRFVERKPKRNGKKVKFSDTAPNFILPKHTLTFLIL